MAYSKLRLRWKRPSRRGAILALGALLLPAIMIFVGFAINVSYMEMVRTQLRICTDSAAKAALINLGATQSQSSARPFARSVSASNTVAGTTVSFSDGNIEFGNTTKNGSGVYAFSSGGTPLNGSRVTGTVTVPLPFAAFMPGGNFTATQVSLTSRVSHDIVLVLDRSASMAFDLSSNEFSYPPDRTMYSPLQSYFTSPSPTASRWKALTDAVNSFVTVLQSRNLDAHVALVTYSETYSLGNYSATEASLDVPLTSNYSSITTAMNNWGNTPLLGDTNIQAGLNMGVAELTGPRARTTADRTIILLTDGIATSGSTDLAGMSLTNRSASKAVTYTIGFSGQAGTGVGQAALQGAATSGNGVYYYAPTAAQLTAAFQQIADSLPAVLIK